MTDPTTLRTDAPDDPPAVDRAARLSKGVLELATRDCSRMDFLCALTRYLGAELGAAVFELWFTDGDRHVRCCTDGETLSVEVRPGRKPGEGAVSPGRVVSGAFTVGPSDRGAFAIADPVRNIEPAELGQIIGAALAGRQLRDALAERVKELTCLRSLAETFAEDLPLADHLRKAVELLPAAFELADIASAHIEVDGAAYSTAGWTGCGWQLSSTIGIGDTPRGTVIVEYAREGEDLPTGEPFLTEERGLLDSFAHQIARRVEREEAARSRARLEEQVRHADRLAVIGQLAAGVAHELNRPLGSILGFAELATRALASGADAEQVTRDLTRIVQASLHAREIVRKLLFFGRQMPVTTRAVDLSAVVEETRLMIAPACRDAGIAATWNVAPDLPPVHSDPAELQQVVMNLAVNAIQAMPTGGRLRIATLRAGDAVALEVEDTGCGMSPEVLEQAFIPFFTTKDIDEGTGLGLSVVHGIVEAHGGQIDIRSDPTSGTLCRVVLPVTPTANAGGAA